MNQFRRSAMANSQQKPKGGGGGGGWYDNYRLPHGNATPFVIINAEYIDPNPPPETVEFGPDGKPLPVKNIFFKFQQHTRKIFKNGKEYFPKETCSQGHDPHNPKPCAGCMAQDMGDKSVTRSERFAFGIVHLTPYHRHPYIDYKTGQVRMRQDNSGPVFTYSECEGRTCNFCRVKSGQPPVLQHGESFPYNPNDITTEFGHRRYIEVGKNHLANLQAWDLQISSQCSALIYNQQGQLIARCSQQLTRESYNCSQCGSVLIDLATDPRSDKELEMVAAKPYVCLKCQKRVWLKEVVSCEMCASAGRQFSQLGLKDVVLWGKRQGEGTQSQLFLQQFQTIEEFQRTLPPHIQQLLGGKSVQDVIEELSEPFDFDNIFRPRSLEEQAKRLELNLPQLGAPQVSAYSPFVPPNAMGMPQQVQGAPIQQQYAPYVPYSPQQPAAAPQYAPYNPSQTLTNVPGPQPFQPPFKPNFSK